MKLLNSLLDRHPEKILANVEIYTWQTCPFCIRAKLLLWWKGAKYTEYKIDGDETARTAMAERSPSASISAKKLPNFTQPSEKYDRHLLF
jgi:glutaredoxin 3